MPLVVRLPPAIGQRHVMLVLYFSICVATAKTRLIQLLHNGKSDCWQTGNAGFARIGLLILVVIMGIVLAATLQVGTSLRWRAAKQAPLDIAMEIQRAFTSYDNATPVGQIRAAASLQGLLGDPRFSIARRHL